MAATPRQPPYMGWPSAEYEDAWWGESSPRQSYIPVTQSTHKSRLSSGRALARTLGQAHRGYASLMARASALNLPAPMARSVR